MCMCVCMTSCVWLLVASWTVDRQAPPPREFSRQEYWSRLPFPTPRDLPDLGIEPTSLSSPALASKFFTTESPGKPYIYIYMYVCVCMYTDCWYYIVIGYNYGQHTILYIITKNHSCMYALWTQTSSNIVSLKNLTKALQELSSY